MGMIEIERYSLITVEVSACTVHVRTTDRMTEESIAFPADSRRILALNGWLCESAGSRLCIREGKKSAFKETMQLAFSPCTDIEITYQSIADSRNAVKISNVISMLFTERPGRIDVEYFETEKKKDTLAYDELSIEELKQYIDGLKERLKMDINTAKSMEQGAQVKIGIISEHLEKAEKELAKAEKIIEDVINSQQENQATIERATQTTGTINR